MENQFLGWKQEYERIFYTWSKRERRDIKKINQIICAAKALASFKNGFGFTSQAKIKN